MMLTSLVVYSTGCSACSQFKEKYEKVMMSVFSEKGVGVMKYESQNLKPLRDVSPSFLQYVSFYPCIILIDTETLAIADKLSANLVLSLVSVFRGQTLKPGNPSPFVSEPIIPYSINAEGFSRFVDDYAKKRMMEKQLMFPSSPPTSTNDRGSAKSKVAVTSRVNLVNRWGQ